MTMSFGPGTTAGHADPFQTHEKARIRAAARQARRIYPGDVGELVSRELIAYAEFGIRFSVDSLIPRLATQILATHAPEAADVTPITDRRPPRFPERAEAS